MIAQFTWAGQAYEANLNRPLDISIPLFEGETGVNCFYAPFYETAPVRQENFLGSTQEGGAVNFRNVRINPHGNGTHTECVGHISREPYSLLDCLSAFHFPALLITLYPQKQGDGDRLILREQLEEVLGETQSTPALVIRTMPNEKNFKWHAQYSGTNPPYLDHRAVTWLVDEWGLEHLLIDLPSVDREEDGGRLLAHKAFWQYPDRIRTHCTISELVYVNNSIPDGLYLLNIHVGSYLIDVSPSKPVLYTLRQA